jgi:hypothetical protein
MELLPTDALRFDRLKPSCPALSGRKLLLAWRGVRGSVYGDLHRAVAAPPFFTGKSVYADEEKTVYGDRGGGGVANAIPVAIDG